ncbi:MAG: hypothetical protein RIS43_256, partial [Actinomycetota bacterium]
MKLVVPAETRNGERRVAVVPDLVGKLKNLGLDVVVESGAGNEAGATDSAYVAAGAQITKRIAAELKTADIVASVRPLTPAQAKNLKKGAVTLSFLSPATDKTNIKALAAAGATSLSFELVP